MENNLLTTDVNLIAENFNEFFVNIGKKLAQNIGDSKNTFLSYMTHKLANENSCAFHLATGLEIMDIVKATKNGDSAGTDEISMNLIKSVIDCIAEPLSVVINLCLINGSFPDQLKIAKVCPIFKEGSKANFANYRPISIIPSFSKIFEKVISNRLLSYITKFNIFNPAQYGFRKNHSTYMAMLNLYDKASDAIDENEYSIGIFIDLSKAFDTINHDILLRKLDFYGIRGIPNLLIKSYLNNRKQYVIYNNCAAALKPISCGVPQGSILGPLLFLLYINDMTHCCTFCCLLTIPTSFIPILICGNLCTL